MARITILDPTATPPEVNPDPGPPFDAAALGGARIGIRYDLTWRSFDWVRDEWATQLAADGAAVAQWCAGDRTGDAADATLAELRTFSAEREVVVSGLGN